MNLKRLLNETDFDSLKNLLQKMEAWDVIEVPGIEDRISKLKLDLNSAGFDPWGLHPETLRKAAPLVYLLYRKYFRVEVSGAENIPEGRCLFIGNHGGQIPIDALMAGLAIFMESTPPKIARAMVERWVPTVPFVSSFFTRVGAMVGDPQNCRELLLHDQSVMVFPEGVRGSGKLFKDRYQLQRFGNGFVRLAVETQSPIFPVAIIGTEETYPGLHNFETLAKIIGAPYFPITPFFPFFGPLGLIPMPTKITVRFGKPIVVQGTGDETETWFTERTNEVKDQLQNEINEGLKLRGDRIFTGAAK